MNTNPTAPVAPGGPPWGVPLSALSAPLARSALSLWQSRRGTARTLVALAALTLFIGGCAAMSAYLPGGAGAAKSSYVQRTYETDAATGDRVVKAETIAESAVKHPANMKESGPSSVGPLGVEIGSQSNYEVELSMVQSGVYHYAAIALFIAAAAVAYFLKAFVFAGLLAGAGLICMFANSIIQTVGPIVNFLIIGCIVIGLIYIIGKYVMGIDFKKRAWASHAKLMNENKPGEAMAALRAGNPEVDRNYKRNVLKVPQGPKVLKQKGAST